MPAERSAAAMGARCAGPAWARWARPREHTPADRQAVPGRRSGPPGLSSRASRAPRAPPGRRAGGRRGRRPPPRRRSAWTGSPGPASPAPPAGPGCRTWRARSGSRGRPPADACASTRPRAAPRAARPSCCASEIRTRTIGRSPEMPRPHSSGCSARPASMISEAGRKVGAANITWPANRWNWPAWLRLIPRWCSCTCTCVQASAAARSNAPASWCLSTSPSTSSREPARHGPEVDARRLAGLESQTPSEREDRIEHGPGRPGERAAVDDRGRGLHAAAAADEARAVGLELLAPNGTAVHDGQMRRPDLRLVRRPAPPMRQKGARVGQMLGLDKQLGEGGVGGIGRARGEHELGVGGDLDLARLRAEVRERHAAHLGVVLGGHQHLERGRQRPVAAGDLGAILVEDRRVAVAVDSRRLQAGGPDLAAARVAQEDVERPSRRKSCPHANASGRCRARRCSPSRPRSASRCSARSTAVAYPASRSTGCRDASRLGRPPARGRRRRTRRRTAAAGPRRGAPAPATEVRSPGRRNQRGNAGACGRRAGCRRWRRSTCPGGGPCRPAPPRSSRPPAAREGVRSRAS